MPRQSGTNYTTIKMGRGSARLVRPSDYSISRVMTRAIEGGSLGRQILNSVINGQKSIRIKGRPKSTHLLI